MESARDQLWALEKLSEYYSKSAKTWQYLLSRNPDPIKGSARVAQVKLQTLCYKIFLLNF